LSSVIYLLHDDYVSRPRPTSKSCLFHFFFFFIDTPPTDIYTLSLHDALPISHTHTHTHTHTTHHFLMKHTHTHTRTRMRSEEHTSALQSHLNLVCRPPLE